VLQTIVGFILVSLYHPLFLIFNDYRSILLNISSKIVPAFLFFSIDLKCLFYNKLKYYPRQYLRLFLDFLYFYG